MVVCCVSVMRIGKKSKDSESKSQVMDSISRLICTSKTQTSPLTGEWRRFGCPHPLCIWYTPY